MPGGDAREPSAYARGQHQLGPKQVTEVFELAMAEPAHDWGADEADGGAWGARPDAGQAEHKRELAACQARRGGADFTRLVVALRGSVECLSSVTVETVRVCQSPGCGVAQPSTWALAEDGGEDPGHQVRIASAGPARQ